ncbi:hypothetical protein JTE90_022974 [Oedothorax gibbosus]|uniref:Uncharacterized protein n=1 Tax=Oedothorax gibbosus TaxID=931172 RepID=A0AAV6VBI9_9ARAC|nr:hypothetical protein JTE90_022974 [Oedothorax gibbosus]
MLLSRNFYVLRKRKISPSQVPEITVPRKKPIDPVSMDEDPQAGATCPSLRPWGQLPTRTPPIRPWNPHMCGLQNPPHPTSLRDKLGLLYAR